MLRWLPSLFLLFYATNGFPGTYESAYQTLDWSKAIRFWIDKHQPKLNVSDKHLIAKQVLHHSEQQGVPVRLLVAVITTESRFDPKAHSHHGAKGLTQVVPKWHLEKIKGRNLFDPAVALEVGSRILKDCLTTANNNERKALNCYSGKSGAKAISYQDIVINHRQKFSNILPEFVIDADAVDPIDN